MSATGGSDGRSQLIVPVDLSHESWRVLPLARILSSRLAMELRPVFVDVSTLGSHTVLEHSVTLFADVDGAGVSIEVLPGADVAGAIRGALTERPGNKLLMSTHGLGGFAARAWGTVSDELIGGPDAEIVAVGPGFDESSPVDIRRVAVCADPDAPDFGVLRAARTWASELAVPMVILVPSGAVGPGDRAPSLLHTIDLLTDESGEATVRILDGADVPDAVAEYVAQNPGTLLAFAVSHDTRAHVVNRRVAIAIARSAPCPMLLRGPHRRTAIVPPQRSEPVGSSRQAELTTCHDDYPTPAQNLVLAPSLAGTARHGDGTRTWG